MPKATVKRLIECNKKQLVDLVLDIENYPMFIPYCLDAKIYEKKKEKNMILIIADLTIGKGPFKATYKSDVRFNKDTDTILVTNIEGPLKHLYNKWFFLEKGNFTEISFDIDFEIENKFLNILMTKSFQYGLDKIADSFQRRANDLFRDR
ncbi:type II toxin-antitoxin system RatA family toxin [Candidatus Pelagibacter sp. Uisw_099_02]|uniref:type II toxin-antitoxin system RatA family toxin n=1 Tax=Candidatus Pelagibacter sp. Uisw_099_02 TaxID=3230981 RepID=UPI0039E95881